jgi:hypothetical protein
MHFLMMQDQHFNHNLLMSYHAAVSFREATEKDSYLMNPFSEDENDDSDGEEVKHTAQRGQKNLIFLALSTVNGFIRAVKRMHDGYALYLHSKNPGNVRTKEFVKKKTFF